MKEDPEELPVQQLHFSYINEILRNEEVGNDDVEVGGMVWNEDVRALSQLGLVFLGHPYSHGVDHEKRPDALEEERNSESLWMIDRCQKEEIEGKEGDECIDEEDDPPQFSQYPAYPFHEAQK